MATIPAPSTAASGLGSGSSGFGKGLAEPDRGDHRFSDPSICLQLSRRTPERPQGACQPRECTDTSKTVPSSGGLLSLPRAVYGPPLVPPQSASSFWQPDGSFSCDWGALKTGEAFCASVKAACAFCLSRSLGGQSALTSALLERLRSGAKVAVEDEVGRLIQSVKSSAGASPGQQSSSPSEAAMKATQELMKHPALQAVAFLSVHERRLAVFEIWLDRWQVLSGGYPCTCGSAEAAHEELTRLTPETASKTIGRNASTEAAIEGLRAQVARLREEARNTHQEEELTVSEARSLSMNLVAKQQQLLLETERVKALEKTRADPTVSLMQSVQQQLTSPAADSIIAPHKEPLCFIAEKCNKLANLARLMQQQQCPQLPSGALVRPSWQVSQMLAATGDGGIAGEAGGGPFGRLPELLTPHASLHSPWSQRARVSSHFASPVAPHGGAHQAREVAVRGMPQFEEVQGDGRSDSSAAGGDTGSPLFRTAGHNKARGEAVVTPCGRKRVASPPSSARQESRPLAEVEGSKRRREAEEPEASRRRRGHVAGVMNTDLDVDAEAAWKSAGGELRRELAQEALWVDSFLRRRAEV